MGICRLNNKMHRIWSEDLYGRSERDFDRNTVGAFVAGKVVAVSGAGGSIGSELARILAGFSLTELVLFDHSEAALHAVANDVSEIRNRPKVTLALCNIRDRGATMRTFTRHVPDIVFHAAALKHVPLVEAHPIEGTRTNVHGTRNIALACQEVGTGSMVNMSTDKAVKPAGILGATKQLAEHYCQALDVAGGPTRFTSVRCGNVLGSSGSVVPLFERQLAAGGPLTVTHPDVTRYFMSIREAAQLVLHAAVMNATESQRGAIHVLNMGKSVRIADLARQMILRAGRQPGKDIEIKFIGLRPGEKLHEELVHPTETVTETSVDGVLKVERQLVSLPILNQQINQLESACDDGLEDKVVRLLKQFVPGYLGAARAI